MIDISAILKNKTLDTEKLLAYGFQESEDAFIRDYRILKNQYITRIFIRADGQADFRVYDVENNEEYMPAHVYNASGAFVGEIHKACEDILKDVAKECYFTEYFKWEQVNRILRFIKETYSAEPEFLWSSLPECAALRVRGKKPWFAVVGRIPKEKVGVEEGGIAEVINLKDEPKAVDARVDGVRAFPAYHMNKQHWYTLFLDDRMTDDEIIDLVRKSFELVNG